MNWICARDTIPKVVKALNRGIFLLSSLLWIIDSYVFVSEQATHANGWWSTLWEIRWQIVKTNLSQQGNIRKKSNYLLMCILSGIELTAIILTLKLIFFCYKYLHNFRYEAEGVLFRSGKPIFQVEKNYCKSLSKNLSKITAS